MGAVRIPVGYPSEATCEIRFPSHIDNNSLECVVFRSGFSQHFSKKCQVIIIIVIMT